MRYLYAGINWNNRLIAITGARGVGKTTLQLQHISMNYDINSSEALYVYRSGAELSRRAIRYTLNGMSLREYLDYEHGIKISPVTLPDILKDHIPISVELVKSFRPIAIFREYIKYGYFPYYNEDKEGYLNRVAETVNTIIEVDLPSNLDIEYQTIIKIKRLFSIISSSVPFKPNISKLAEQTGTTRPSLRQY